MRLDPLRLTPAAVGGSDVDSPVLDIVGKAPQRCRRPVRENRIRTTGQNGGHPKAPCREQRAHRKDTLVHAKQTSNPGPLHCGRPRETETLQLLKRHETMLPPSNPRDLSVKTLPTGLKPIYLIGLRSVGGGVGGHGG